MCARLCDGELILKMSYLLHHTHIIIHIPHITHTHTYTHTHQSGHHYVVVSP